MEPAKPSLTALITAFSRAHHALHDEPKIFHDYLARELFAPEELAFLAHNIAKSLEFFEPEAAAACPDEASALAKVMRLQNGPITLSHSRYAEEALAAAVERGVRQYVILGAGLDTFAFRRPDLALEIFEVDHPATQADKRERLARLGRPIPERLHFVPADLARESLAEALGRSAYDPTSPAFFSWLGVSIYLERTACLATLRAVASLAAPGSGIVFDYFDLQAFDPAKAAKRMRQMQEIVRRAGEPIKTGFDPAALGAELAELGLRVEEDLGPEEIEERYFRGRTDGYHAFPHVRFARAGVAQKPRKG